MDAAAYIRRETIVSTIINIALSVAFFLAVFGQRGAVTVWGMGGFVFDFAPQGFMIGLMATLVPGLLARKARAGGKIGLLEGTSTLPAAILLRGLLCGVVGAVAGVVCSAALLWISGMAELAWAPALFAKLAFAAVLALVVTPTSLRAEMIKR